MIDGVQLLNMSGNYWTAVHLDRCLYSCPSSSQTGSNLFRLMPSFVQIQPLLWDLRNVMQAICWSGWSCIETCVDWRLLVSSMDKARRLSYIQTLDIWNTPV